MSMWSPALSALGCVDSGVGPAAPQLVTFCLVTFSQSGGEVGASTWRAPQLLLFDRMRAVMELCSRTPVPGQLIGGSGECSAAPLEPEPASLLAVPDSLLHALCCMLDAPSCLALRAVCRPLSAALMSAEADLGIWKSFVVAELAAQDASFEAHSCSLAVGRPHASFEAHSCSLAVGRPHERSYAFIWRHADKLGAYLWPRRVMGGVLTVGLQQASSGALCVVATVTLRPGVGQAYEAVPAFRIHHGREPHMKWFLEKEPMRLGLVGEDLLDFRAFDELGPSGIAFESDGHQRGEWERLLAVSNGTPERTGAPGDLLVGWEHPKVRRVCRALAAGPPRAAIGPLTWHSSRQLASLEALGPRGAAELGPYYHGRYGPHGVELCHVSWGRLVSASQPLLLDGPDAAAIDGLLGREDYFRRDEGGNWPRTQVAEGFRGLKLCGDPNVPAGRFSFAAWGALEPTERVPPARCRCMFMCSCLQPDESELVVLGAMRGVARTARHGYRYPEDHPAKLVFFRSRAADACAVPAEMRDAGRAPDPDAVQILVIFDGREFQCSMRLTPIELFGCQSSRSYSA